LINCLITARNIVKKVKYVLIIQLIVVTFFTMIFPSCTTLNKEPESRVIMGRDKNFVAFNDGTVLDIKTGLMWANVDNGYRITWEDAKRYCESYKGGGYVDWRMPTILELRGIFYPYGLNKDGFHISSFIKIHQCCVWASDTKGAIATFFNFRTERWSWGLPDELYYRVLPVRDSKKKNKYIYAYLHNLP